MVTLFAEGEAGAQTVSWLTRNLDQTVVKLHQGLLADDRRYLLLDGVSLWMQRPGVCKRV